MRSAERRVAVAAAMVGAVFTVGLLSICPGRGLALAPSSHAFTGARAVPRVDDSASALIAASTGQQLYAANAQAELPIASTTKLMTALLTLEHVKRLSTIYAQNDWYPAEADSQIGLVPGERMSVHDLLLAMLLPSADDAAEDLAYNVGHGSVSYFVAMMNVRARELGLTHTHYSTPIGLDTPGNYSSAWDLLTLTRFLLAHHPFFARAVALRGTILKTGNVVRYVTNRNDLVGQVPWIIGVKTGHTLDAGYVLVGAGKQNGMTLLSAVLGTPSESARDSDTLALLDYGFQNFVLRTPVVGGRVLARPPVQDQSGRHPAVIAANTFTHVFARTARVATRVELPRQLAGPLARHAVVGAVLVLADGRVLARVPLLVAQAVPAVSTLTMAAGFITRPVTLVVLVVLLIGGLAMARFWRGRTRRTRAAGPKPA